MRRLYLSFLFKICIYGSLLLSSFSLRFLYRPLRILRLRLPLALKPIKLYRLPGLPFPTLLLGPLPTCIRLAPPSDRALNMPVLPPLVCSSVLHIFEKLATDPHCSNWSFTEAFLSLF